MNYVNNWLRPITLGAAETSAALDLPDGSYRLCISDASGDMFEVVDAVAVSGAATFTRGLEGTAAQEWPAGSSIYCSVTAGMLARLGCGGAGSPEGVVVAPPGTIYIDTDTDDAWVAATSDSWYRLAYFEATQIVDSGSGFVVADYAFNYRRVFMQGIYLDIHSSIGDVHTNLPLTVNGAGRRFTATDSAYYLEYSSSGDGVLVLMGWPLAVSAPPAP